MAGLVRLNKAGLNDLINNIKEHGNDPTELENLLADVEDDERAHRPVRRQTSLRIQVEEPTTEERLEAEVGELFGGAIPGPVMAAVIEFDRNHTLAEIKKMCVEAGISPSGHKKELAAKLLAKGVK